MRIVPASREDCRAVAELHVACWKRAYEGIVPSEYLASLSIERREGFWRQVLSEGRSELLVAWVGESLAGFVSYGASRDADATPDRGEISAIYVAPGAWSTGVGTALWQAASRRLLELDHSTISLWVIVGNERAIRFYVSAGFRAEPNSEKTIEIGGSELREVRLVFENCIHGT
jgi:ribosomal protein S18 acetylase RimI-like enzyme